MKSRGSEDSAPETSPISIIRDIQNGTLAAQSLSSKSRRACIEHLRAEGYGASEISEIFKVSVRTVRRDLAQIREDHAVTTEPKFVARTVGALVHESEISIARLRRVARDRECPHATKVEAERLAWVVTRETVETLQSLGYLPTAAQQIQADLTHRIEGDQLQQDFHEVEAVLREVGLPIDSPAARQLQSLKLRLELPTLLDSPLSATSDSPDDSQAIEDSQGG